MDTSGTIYSLRARCFAARGAEVLAGGHDGRIYRLAGAAFVPASNGDLGGRVMDVRDFEGYIWATTDKGAVWCVRPNGAAKQILAGAVDYGGNSWFGPRFGDHDGLCLARKIRDGNKWRCVIERVTIK